MKLKIKLNVMITDNETIIQFDNNKNILKITDAESFKSNSDKQEIYLLMKEKQILNICDSTEKISAKYKYDCVITINTQTEINLQYLKYILVEQSMKIEIKVDNKILKEVEIQENKIDSVNEYKNKIMFILKKFGYNLFEINDSNAEKEEKTPQGKTRHKWTKEISKIKFYLNSKGGEGEAIWQKKDELVLLAGAKLVETPQTNKDGKINYSAKFAQKIRNDHSDKIVNNKTTEDIIFDSPNMLGMFLFFGGQNTWQELKDENGKTLDDWSKID